MKRLLYFEKAEKTLTWVVAPLVHRDSIALLLARPGVLANADKASLLTQTTLWFWSSLEIFISILKTFWQRFYCFMESNRKDCAATFALLLPVKVKLKVEATRSHKSKKQTKPQFLNGRWSMQSEYFAGGVGARQLRHMQGRVLCRSRVHSVGVAGSAAETSRRVSTFAFLPPWSLTQTTFSSILCSRSSTKGVSWTHTVSLMPFKDWELLLLWSWSSSF